MTFRDKKGKEKRTKEQHEVSRQMNATEFRQASEISDMDLETKSETPTSAESKTQTNSSIDSKELLSEASALIQEQKKHGRKSRKKRGEEAVIDGDLEFITHESVRDKSKMADGEVIQDEIISKKKTKRRSVDVEAAKKERVRKIARSHWLMILLGIVAVIVVIGLISFAVKRQATKKAAENQEQAISVQELEKDGNEQISELVTAYYECYAAGDTESILQYAYPMTDSEKSYIQMYSEYVDEYQNIVCYTKSGEDGTSYIVSASFNVKYKDVDSTAPGMDFFYVRTDETGNLYIDNTYSPFNLLYQEYTLDQNIVQLIQDYEAGDDIIALQAGVQTNYEGALEQDATLNTMVNETIANAVSAWTTEYQATVEQKAAEAAEQVQEEETAEAEQAAAEQAAAEQAAAEQAAAEANAETENKAWVYATDTVYIRQEPSETSEALASATAGSKIRQLATTNSGWSKVKSGDVVGYIKSEYLSSSESSSSGSTSSGSSLSQGQTITLTASTNVRSAMSETSDRIGLAYAGEKVTVEMVYSEGWCKVTWNGQEGYIRSDVLAAQ